MAGIDTLVDNIVEAFIALAIGALVISMVFGLDVAGTGNDSLLQDIETEVNDGMIAVAGVIVLIAVIYVVRMLRNR